MSTFWDLGSQLQPICPALAVQGAPVPKLHFPRLDMLLVGTFLQVTTLSLQAYWVTTDRLRFNKSILCTEPLTWAQTRQISAGA